MRGKTRGAWLVTVLGVAGVLLASDFASAARIKDLCSVQGVRGNKLSGAGIVVGLAGTGDSTSLAVLALERALRRKGVEVNSAADLTSKNVAVVWVTTEIPAFAKEGTRLDVMVNSMGDSKSLEGGTLLETHLMGADGNVYAVASGSVSVGGFSADASGSGSNVRNNHVTAGRIPMGAFVEREVPSTITQGENINLLLSRPDFVTANNIQVAINKAIGPGSARALGAGTVKVRIPKADHANLTAFIAKVQSIGVESDTRAVIMINERTGTIVVGGDVRIRPCHVAHGGLTVSVTATPDAIQPLPFSGGTTVPVVDATIEADQPLAYLMELGGSSAAEVAEGLNKLKVTPRDMISIFQALRMAGVMDADLEIM